MRTPVEPMRRAFKHEALLYEGRDDFIERVTPFVREGVERQEPVLVVVDAMKGNMLRSALGADGHRVRFSDMAAVGRNPSRIIPAWQAFVQEHAGSPRRLRGVGEPIWAGRSDDELAECERHEALLNLAFADGPAWRLMCPYDASTLAFSVLEEAERNHPVVSTHGEPRESSGFRPLSDVERPFDRPLPEPTGQPDVMTFGISDLGAVRRFTRRHAMHFGLGSQRVEDVVLAVDEVATNSIRHGGGQGHLRIWGSGRTLISEISDAGRIDDPLAGRRRPRAHQASGFGLWAVNQLCDLVQIRVFEGGSVVRMHMSLG